MVRFPRLVLADMRLGELGQPQREVDVGARVIDAPPSAVALEGIAEDDAAEVKAAVEILRRRRTGAKAEPAASAKLRVGGDRGTEDDRNNHDREGRAPPPRHPRSVTRRGSGKVEKLKSGKVRQRENRAQYAGSAKETA